MKYEIKGNYFNGEFHYPVITGPQAVEHFIKRECPADLEVQLWEMPIEYRDIPELLESASHGFNFWKRLSSQDRIVFFKALSGTADPKEE